jgi:hypothetical protein
MPQKRKRVYTHREPLGDYQHGSPIDELGNVSGGLGLYPEGKRKRSGKHPLEI